jgi:hypothetical protein
MTAQAEATTLRSQAERAEKAEASEQREVLEQAFEAIHGPIATGGDYDLWSAFAKKLWAEAYESAAMMLVPEGWIVNLHRGFDDDGEYWATVELIDSFSVERGCDPDDRRAVKSSRGAAEASHDPTALALVAASLRAHAHMENADAD